jgi:two-component system, OmpR family, sensor histidine kinase CiaH
MGMFKSKRLLIATMVYWFLLVYIIAALVWWFIALQQQNHQMTSFKISQLKMDDPDYAVQSGRILYEQQRKTAQYIGEGATFLVLFLVGAIFVYLPVRRQINLQQQQQNFMMAVTHELKTPIAVAKLNLETLMKYPLDEAKKQKILGSALHEINRLDGLANNILVSAQLESGRYLSSKEQLDMSALTERVVADFCQRFPERSWSSHIEPDLVVSGDLLLLQMLLNNLIENALKYSPKQGLITVDLSSANAQVILRVKDQGPGVPVHERKTIFQKFYRIGNEQTRTTQGTGLGLYLSKKIASDHNARIEVTDNTPTGSTFVVEFWRATKR